MSVRSLAVVVLLASAVAAPATADAANQRGRVTPRVGKRPQRPVVRPRPQVTRGQGLGESRMEPAEAEASQKRPIAMGRVSSHRNSFRHGEMRPKPPGYGDGTTPIIGTGNLGKVGGAIVGVLAVGIVAIAAVAIGVPLLHNLPQLLGLR